MTRARFGVAATVMTALLMAAACGDEATSTPATTTPGLTSTTGAVADSTTTSTTTVTTTTDTTDASTTTDVATTAVTTTSTTTPAPAIDVRIYLLRGERLAIEHRDVPGPAVLRGALDALVAGPTADEPDLVTTIPAGTRVRGVDLDDGIATVDLTGEFDTGGGSASVFARIAQVVFTATQFDNVDAVRFWIDGAPIDYLTGEGIVMTEPWTRAMVGREWTAGVLFDEPAPGTRVTSPFTVTGEGDVYEAQFMILVRRGDEILATVPGVWAGSWGNWADFSTTVTVDAAPGPIEVVGFDAGGCGDDPECPPILETVLPLELAGS